MSITSITGIALSGMNAQTSRLAAVANNVANADTPDYGRQTVSLTSTLDPAGVGTTVTSGPEDVDLATEKLELTEAELGYKANAAVFEAGADLWDVLATIKRD
ncbi:MAG: flagellar basal body rod protein [Rhizobium sp.]|nr:flagellar basal body rod protein [Rhizobium sp.]